MNGWKQVTGIPKPSPPDGRGIGIGFSIGNFGYIGFGTDDGVDFDDLYRYDPALDTWTKMASLGTGLESPVCLVINDKAYVGTGQSRQLGDFTTLFYEYDPFTNGWTRKADFPGGKRSSALGLSVGGKGYVGLGFSPGGNSQRDLWQYDPSTDKWSQRADFPDTTTCPEFPIGFTLDGGSAFAGGASSGNIGVNVWWQYNAATDHWTQMHNFPGTGMILASPLVVNGIGYIVGGGNTDWKYDPVGDQWTRIAFFGNCTGGSTFSVGGKGYFGTGRDSLGVMHTDLWQYSP